MFLKQNGIVFVFQAFLRIYGEFFPNGGDPTKFGNFLFKVFDQNKVRTCGALHSLHWQVMIDWLIGWLVVSVVLQDGHIQFHEFIQALSITSRGNLDEKLNCTLATLHAHNFCIKIFNFTVFVGEQKMFSYFSSCLSTLLFSFCGLVLTKWPLIICITRSCTEVSISSTIPHWISLDCQNKLNSVIDCMHCAGVFLSFSVHVKMRTERMGERPRNRSFRSSKQWCV